MRHLPNIAGALLGLVFIAPGLMVLLGYAPEQPPPPEGSYMALFMGAFVPSGYLTFVKVLEVVGGVLVAVPRTRGLGLLGRIAAHVRHTRWAGARRGFASTATAADTPARTNACTWAVGPQPDRPKHLAEILLIVPASSEGTFGRCVPHGMVRLIRMRARSRRVACAFAASVAVWCPAAPLPQDGLAAALEAAVARARGESTAPVSVAAARVDGLPAEVAFTYGVVAAVPGQGSSPEVSRLVTALLVLESIRVGELGCDEPIARVLPVLDRLPQPLTVRDLRRGGTGLRDIRDVLEASADGRARMFTAGEALHFVALQRRLARDVSAWGGAGQHDESPTEDLLLALAVESRAGAPFADVAAARLFAPLGLGSTAVALDPAADCGLGALIGFRGVTTSAEDLARLGLALLTCDTLHAELGATVLGDRSAPTFATGGEPFGARWRAFDARMELGRDWLVFGDRRPSIAGHTPLWPLAPETARFAVLPSEGWVVAAMTPQASGSPSGLAATIAAATRALEPWLAPRTGFQDYLGIGGGAGGRYGGRVGGTAPAGFDDASLLGAHRVPELELDLVVTRTSASTARRLRYEVRVGTREPLEGGLSWRNETLILKATSAAHRLTLRIRCDGDSARFESLDLERGFTTYGPLIGLAIGPKE